jgi:CO/xanthine dehydrogenase Mo-binding subunit/aerobic-type carbon monoxide dehydrogenase small subunit (CoxS/CutS family)
VALRTIRLETSVNGSAVTAAVPANRLLIDFLRDDLQLKGTKLSCDVQVCGACTVLLDGRPVSACTTLAHEVRGRAVRTIEGLGDDTRLHPMQQAFIDHAAFQCGFCTPGMIMAATALVTEIPEPRPSDIGWYMKGNICRCTGYQNIVGAIVAAATELRGSVPGGVTRCRTESVAKGETKLVGTDVARVDGVEKVTGRARFTGDLVVPGMLAGQILRSPHAHARIVRIDASRAEALPGVAAVLTAGDIADLDPYYAGRPVIAIGKVRYVGEPVAAVAAADQPTAEEALSLIEVEYDDLPAVIGLDAALADDAPQIHESAPGNICSHEHVERGDVERGFAESDEIVEHVFTFPMVYHYAMEPHAVIAAADASGITIWSSAQHPFPVREDIARIFRRPVEQVRMIVPYLGGGFGSKSFTKFEPLVVALARKAGKPVRICNSVKDSMLTVRRHAARVKLKTGVKRDGTLMAREAVIHLDTGGYADNGPQVAIRAASRVLAPYRIPHIRSDAYAVYTNTVSAGSFRAIGAPQTIFASESQMDAIATRLGIDPVDLRFKNFLVRGEELRPHLRGMDADLASSLNKLVAVSHWKERAAGTAAALGLACGATNAGGAPVSAAMVRREADGLVRVFAGSTEMGQGVRTVLSQIVADELDLPLSAIRLEGADTSVTPYDSSTGSSRSTTLMGLAVQRAAADLKRQLIEAGGAAGELTGHGEVGPEVTGSLPVFWEIGMGTAEIDVDEETGEIAVTRYVSVADVGKAIHPQQCIAQEEGAAMMGIGHTLFEEIVYEGQEPINANLVDYRVPTFADLPEEFHTELVENRDGPGPYGARGMGEGGILSVAPAVANAFARAYGIRITDLPLTPERIWRALRARKSK